MAETSLVPIACVERHPTRQTVWFKGVPINLAAIANCFRPPLDVPYLSKIFAGKRTPSLEMAKQIAGATGMDLTAFVEGLDGCPYPAIREDTDDEREDSQAAG